MWTVERLTATGRWVPIICESYRYRSEAWDAARCWRKDEPWTKFRTKKYMRGEYNV